MPIRYTIKDMQSIAREHGGKCLSKDYIDLYSPLEWMCKRGHRWDADYAIIRQGAWCMRCAKAETKLERLHEFQKIAESKGGKCLSKEYINSYTKLKWKCKLGHVWESLPSNVKHLGNWCAHCAGCAKLTISDMREAAKQRGGKCLSFYYVNSKTKLKWQCMNRHFWSARPNDILSGKWCPKCGLNTRIEKQKDDISIYQNLAKRRGGKLLSKVYISSNTRLEWQCKERHRWIATPNNVKNLKQWCPYCSGKMKHSITDMQQAAKLHKGKCLSLKYRNNHTKLRWQCSKGHQWAASGKDIMQGHWCAVCYHDRRRIAFKASKAVSESVNQ